MLICSCSAAESVVEAEPKHWNVISIGKRIPPKALCAHQCHLIFDDVNRGNLKDPRIRSQVAAGWLRPPKRCHVQTALRFARSHGLHDLLVHCREGVSRSPAMAWCILLDQGGCPEKATNDLFAIHPRCRPNDLVVQIGLEVIKGHAQDLSEVLAGIDRVFAPPDHDVQA